METQRPEVALIYQTFVTDGISLGQRGRIRGHPLKGCLSRAKTIPMQEKVFFFPLY
jgi:hypothetical protein